MQETAQKVVFCCVLKCRCGKMQNFLAHVRKKQYFCGEFENISPQTYCGTTLIIPNYESTIFIFLMI